MTRSAAGDQVSVRAAIAAAFEHGGALDQATRGFVPRPSQLAMGLAVHTAIATGGTLVAEAGTGTGKTFAYLVPALLAGGKLLISTGTKPLQDQLFGKDLPAVLRALKINAATALLKGRQNYLCLHRLEQTRTGGMLASRDEVRQLAAIGRFASLTTSGDRAELSEVPENASIWPQVTSTRDNCLGAECPRFGDCFVYKARRVAQEADVVVVNHHLFLADLALRDDAIRDFLPTVDTVILDEAHQLPDVAAEFFGSSLSLAQALELARDARALGQARAADGASWIQITASCERAARDVRLALGEMGLQPGARIPLARLRQRARLAARLSELGETVGELRRALEINRSRDGELDLVSARAVELERVVAGWQAAVAEVQDDESAGETAPEGAGASQTSSDDAPDANPVVRWIGVSPHGAQFRETPLAPGKAIARARAQQPQAWILTSATLTTGGRFEHALAELGLPDAATARWESPFDFGRQALMYLPENMPSPQDADFSEQVADHAWPLIRANGGRAFVLCTTLRAVDRVAERLRVLLAQEDLDLPLLVQGAATRRGLIDAFRASGRAVLVGSISFWEGIDIRGEALSLVVIDKLPFAPPDDPVIEARIRLLRRQGRNPFSELQLPQAVVLLKQGAGRLIRDEHDHGVLMILDERILSKSYGKTVLASLPPFGRTRSQSEAVAFLTRRRSVPAVGADG